MAEAVQPLDSGARQAAAWRRGGWLRAVPALTLAIFLLPVGAGLIGTWLPAFGYLPALGGESFGLAPWRELLAAPGLGTSIRLTPDLGFPGDRGLARPGDRLHRRLSWHSALRAPAPGPGAALGRAPLGDRHRHRLPDRAQRLGDPPGLALGDRLAVAPGRRPGAGPLWPGARLRVDRQGGPVSVPDDAGRARSGARRRAPGGRPLARLRTGRGLAQDRIAGGLSADPPAGLRGARLLAFGRRHGVGAGAVDPAAARRPGAALVQRSGNWPSASPRPPAPPCSSSWWPRRSGCGAASRCWSRDWAGAGCWAARAAARARPCAGPRAAP